MKFLTPLYVFLVGTFVPLIAGAQGRDGQDVPVSPGTAGGFKTPTTGGGFKTPTTGGPNTGGNAGSGGSARLDNPLKNDSLIGFFNDLLDVVMVFAVPIIVLFIIFSGFKYVTARGNSEAIATANRALLYAVIGGVLILGAKVLLAVISGTIEQIKA